MRHYTIIACIQQTRSYSVRANNAAEAEEIVRSEYELMEYDVVDDEVDSVTVEEYE